MILKPIVGYEGFYEASNIGWIKSLARFSYCGRWLKERILKQSPDGNGYLQVNLWKDGKKTTRTVHSLVAEAFIGPRKEGMDVCHGPGGKLDNSVANLSYKSRRENTSDDRNRDHKYSSRFPGVCYNKQAKKWQAQIQINGKKKHLGLFLVEEEAAEAYKSASRALAASTLQT